MKQIHGLEEAGCEIVRCAVPDMEAAKALASIVPQVNIPVVADIHFHHQLALEALNSGVHCLRLNPGNIRNRGKVEQVVREARARSVPIRIGVNFGSLPPVGKIGVTGGLSRHTDGVNELPRISEAEADQYTVVDHMVATGLWEIGILEDLDFDLIKISLKAFDIETAVEAYRRMAKVVPYPFHLGITEAGTAKSGSVRTSIGLGMLLYEGIGDTIRVSLSDDSREEVATGIEILKALELRRRGRGAGRVSELRQGRRRRDQPGQHGRGGAEADEDADQGGRHGMRGERPRRGEGRGRGHRRGRRPRRDIPQGQEGPRSGRGRHADGAYGRGAGRRSGDARRNLMTLQSD